VEAMEVEPLMGYEKPLAISMLLDRHEPDAIKITSELVNEIHAGFVEEMMDFYRNSPDLKPIENAELVFRELKELGITIGLDTGFNKEIASLVAERLGWLKNGLVQFLVASDEVHHGRPDPYMIYKIMEMAGVKESKQVIKVGDTEVDIHEGKNASCLWSIGVTTGAYTREALEPHRPHFIIDSLQELLPLIKEYEHAG
jgi:phosphonatase-like hydrolase